MRLFLPAKTSAALLIGVTLTLPPLVACVPPPAKTFALAQNDPRTWTTAQWISWRDRQITRILEPTLEVQGTKVLHLQEVSDRCLQAYQTLEPCLQQNSTLFASDSQRAAAMGNFVRFVRAQHWMALTTEAGSKHPHALGLEITDAEYASLAAPHVGFPELLRSQEFLTKMASPATYHVALRMIEDHNALLPSEQKWITLFFKTPFITTADDTKTYGRLLVVIPNEPCGGAGRVDRWVSFGIAPPDMQPVPEIRSVSMFTVHRERSASNRAQVFFSDFMRLQDPQTRQIRLVSNFVLPNNPSKNCYYCHKSALLPIYPKAEYEIGANRTLVEKAEGVGRIPATINRLIQGYGKPDFGPLDTDAYGPCLGPDQKTRSDAFIKDATLNLPLPTTSYDRIRNAMQCARCHESFAPLNFPQAVRSHVDVTAFKSRKGMVESYIEGGSMPPNAPLSPIERQALWQCLIKEYYDPATQQGLLIDWLKGAPDESRSTR